MSAYAVPEYSANITKLLKGGERVELSVDDDLMLAVAQLIDVNGVKNLSAVLELKPWRKNGAQIKGRFYCEVEQTCVATLDEMQNTLQGEFERYFIPDHDKHANRPDIVDGEMILDPVEDDFPDIVNGEKINLWEIVIEEMNLEVDPFPRSVNELPGVESSESAQVQEDTQNPFANLKTLITEKKS